MSGRIVLATAAISVSLMIISFLMLTRIDHYCVDCSHLHIHCALRDLNPSAPRPVVPQSHLVHDRHPAAASKDIHRFYRDACSIREAFDHMEARRGGRR